MRTRTNKDIEVIRPIDRYYFDGLHDGLFRCHEALIDNVTDLQQQTITKYQWYYILHLARAKAKASS